jgi:predicted phosphohydrolase
LSVFAIGDLHLSLGSDKPMDIFAGWENYVDKLKANWNAVVSDEDTVVIVGDISWAMSLENTVDDFRFINDVLHGRKIFLKGNHDYWWSTLKKMNQFLDVQNMDKIRILHNNAYVEESIVICGTRGWISDTGEAPDRKILLREAGRLEMSIQAALKLKGEPVVFIHYPPIFGSEQNELILDVLHKYQIKRCFYGHIHGHAAKKAFNGIKDGIQYKIVSADVLNFAPIKIN